MATTSNEKPHPITILECTSDGKFEINTAALTQIFRQPEIQDVPLSIVSIAGELRGGKSFMLNFFLRYLKRNRNQSGKWMGNEDEPLSDGFKWQSGSDACTKGIMVWSEIYFIRKNEQNIAIMLMDTQGLFDDESDNKINSMILALSTLISSVQIFNLSKQIKKSDLEYLQFFTDYAKAASKTRQSENLFQTLIFLIRDWQWIQNHAYGANGGGEYLHKKLHTSYMKNKQLSSVQEYLTSSFSDIKCVLMPYPGQAVTGKPTFEGHLKDIDSDFLEHTAAFVEGLFKPDNIVVKTINGEVVTAVTILQYVLDCCESFKDGKLPDPKTMTENAAEAQNFQAQKTCIDQYVQSMETNVRKEFVKKEILLRMHGQAKSESLNLFETMTPLGEENSREKHRNYLKQRMEREYRMLLQRNKSKKNEEKEKVWKAAGEIKKNYEEAMEQVTGSMKAVDDKTLEAVHDEYVAKTRQVWQNIEGPDKLKKTCFKGVEDFMNKKTKRLKENNAEKRKIAEAEEQLQYRIQEEQRLRLLRESQHEEEMRKQERELQVQREQKEKLQKQKEEQTRQLRRESQRRKELEKQEEERKVQMQKESQRQNELKKQEEARQLQMQKESQRKNELKKKEEEKQQKLRLEELQKEKNSRLLCLEIEYKYKKKFTEFGFKYVDESDLKQGAEILRSESLYELKRGLIVEGISEQTSAYKEHVKRLAQKFEEDFEQAKELNSQNKDRLLNSLEHERSEAYVEYDNYFKQLLNDAYMEEEHLKSHHDAAVKKLLEKMKSKVGNNNVSRSIFSDHLQRAEQHLNERYSVIQRWNEENDTFLNKCFRVLKSVGKAILNFFGF